MNTETQPPFTKKHFDSLNPKKGNHSVLLAMHEQNRNSNLNRYAIRLTRFEDANLASIFC